MMVWMLLASALAADDSDIVVSHSFSASPEAVYAHLIDIANVQAAAPESCMRGWVTYKSTEGLGTQFRVIYQMEGWRRRLDASVVVAEQPRRIEWDHHGNRGFITRLTIAPKGSGAEVTMHTFINAPPWPFRRYFERKVQPTWRACYTELLDNVASVLGES